MQSIKIASLAIKKYLFNQIKFAAPMLYLSCNKPLLGDFCASFNEFMIWR